MSYAGWVQMYDPDNGTPSITLGEFGNYTSNVSPMWRRALTATVGEPAPGEQYRLQDTEGWSCERAWHVLTLARDWMLTHAEELRELEPDNGWGDYEGAVTYLSRVIEQCRKYRAVPGAHLTWYC